MPVSRQKFGLRTIAMFEALKGVLVLLLGFGALALVHKDLDELAGRFIDFIHAKPAGRVSGFFFALADRTTDKSLWTLAIVAVIYSTLRFAEAYGLWNGRAWAEWFALISGCVYLPWELYGIMHHDHWWKWVIFLINVVIVVYMAKLRLNSRAESQAERKRAVELP